MLKRALLCRFPLVVRRMCRTQPRWKAEFALNRLGRTAQVAPECGVVSVCVKRQKYPRIRYQKRGACLVKSGRRGLGLKNVATGKIDIPVL